MAPEFVSALRRPESSLKDRRRVTFTATLQSASCIVNVRGVPQSDELPNNRVVTSRYTWLTFVPLNLWEQLQRPMNLYFFAVAILLCFPIIAPVSPITIMVPLFVAFAIAGAKEAVDDLHRHRGDDTTNSRLVWRLNWENSDLNATRSEDLRVGDLILLLTGDVVPCDVVPLISEDPSKGTVYCNTANLDGEADAKLKHSLLAIHTVAYSDEMAEMVSEAKEEVAVLRLPSEMDTEMIVSKTQLPPSLATMFGAVLSGVSSIEIECEPPSRVLSSFVGHATVIRDGVSTRSPLTIDDLIVSTSSFVNATFMVGCVIYTGNESKVHRSRKDQPPKYSVIERLTNKFAVSVFGLQLLGVVVMSILFYVNTHSHRHVWYLQINHGKNSDFHALYTPLRSFLLMSIMVPLSVKITLELSKFYISQLIEWDLDLYDEATDTPAAVNNRALAEELGLVQFVLADKTGTLTENSMSLRAIAVGTHRPQLFRVSADTAARSENQTYGGTASENRDVSKKVITSHIAEELWREPTSQHLLRAIVCNNSCEVVTTSHRGGLGSSTRFSTPRSDDHKFSYQSPSPDEVALVCGLAKLNVVLHERSPRALSLRVGFLAETISVLATAPFTSNRGAMSVLIRREGQEGATLYVKGSDDRMAQMRKVGDPAWDSVSRMVDELALEGLRTLVFGCKELSAEQTAAWLQSFRDAELLQDASSRARELARCWEQMESNVDILGATAVEDQLQAEVPSTIQALRSANIRVWMLTGDKHATAVQTGRLSGLLVDGNPLFTFDIDINDTIETQRIKLSRLVKDTLPRGDSDLASGVSMDGMSVGLLSGQSRTPSLHPFTSRAGQLDTANPRDYEGVKAAPYTVVITGRALRVVESSASLMADFDPLFFQAATVICCRVTPDQKALIVALIRRRGALCLAIGDGGNDVAMIQEADVGVGIAGSEGRQAVQASDYAIAKFRFLAPLLLTHGHTAVMRSGYLVQYIFYKSIIIGVIQAVYNSTFALSSGVSFFDSVALTLYNGVFTLALSYLPVLDTHLPRSVLRNDPSLYKMSQSGHYMNRSTFQRYVLRAILHALVILFVATHIFDGDFSGSGGRPYAILDGEYVSVFVPLLLIQCVIVVVEAHSITWWHAALIPLSFASFFVLYAPYSAWLKHARFYGLYETWMGHAPLWLATVLIAALVLVPFCFVAALQFHLYPDQLQRWRQKTFMGQTLKGLRRKSVRPGLAGAGA